MQPKYLDNAATTSVDPRVMEAMQPYFIELFGNASSNHEFGQKSKKAINLARKQVADIVNAEAKEIIFTSGSTEAINLALKGYLEANPENGNHIITVKTEHKAVLNTCEYLETKGTEVTYLDVDKNGIISLEELKNSIKKNTAVICVMYVNNEISVIQPIKEIGQIAKENNIVFFCDATQAIGKVPVDVVVDNIDMLCLSAHKINGPKGIGTLYIRKGIELTPLIHGGGQENGLRGGTYNTPLIVGLGKTCEIAKDEFEENVQKLLAKQMEFENHIVNENIGIINCKEVERAPHLSSVLLNNIEAEDYMLLNRNKYIISSGSACSSSIIQDSHVCKAIPSLSNNSSKVVRFSFGK